MVDQDLHISSVRMVREHLKESLDMDVKDWVVKDIMRKELDLRYKQIKEISWQGNSDKNKILRQIFSENLLEVDFDRKTVLNVDETWLGTTDFRRFKWCSKGENNSSPTKQMQPRISMITALDTRGKVYMSLVQANSNTSMMKLYSSKLIKLLD